MELSPAAPAIDASITSRRDRTLATRLSPDDLRFGCGKITALGGESDFIEIFWPIAETTSLIQIRATYGSHPRLRISLKPVQCDTRGWQCPLRNQRLDPKQQKRTVGLDDNTNSIRCCIRQQSCHGNLSPGMQVNLGLLDEDDLTRSGH